MSTLKAGRILVLNGAPRSGKSTLVRLIQERLPGVWINLGVDMHNERMLPPRYRPGLGLRPGGERVDLEPLLPRLFAALYESMAAHSRAGLDVVADLGHHDDHSTPLGILPDCARRLAGLPAWLIGLHAPIETILARRAASDPQLYLSTTADGSVPPSVLRWQDAVHRPGLYDLTLDTSRLSPEACLARIESALATPSFGPKGDTSDGTRAFERLAAS